MFIKTVKISKKLIIFSVILVFLITSIVLYYSFANDESNNTENEKDFIKWVDFTVTADLLSKTAKLDIDSHSQNSDIKYNWIEILAYLACKNGGNFKNYKQKDKQNSQYEYKNDRIIGKIEKMIEENSKHPDRVGKII